MTAKGQQLKPRSTRSRKAPDHAVSEQWMLDQQDPANWLHVPEFGVRPADVDFNGFAFPILHPRAPMREARENVKDMVRLARELIVLECPTLESQRRAFLAWLDALETPGAKPTRQQYFAAAYGIVMSRLEHALKQTEPEVRIEIPGERGIENFFEDAMTALSLAGSTLAEWSMKRNAIELEIDADSLRQMTLSELGRKGRAKTLSETESMKAEVRQWCESHRWLHKQLNPLARAAVSAKINAAAYSTVRGWLTEWAPGWRAEGWPTPKPPR